MREDNLTIARNRPLDTLISFSKMKGSTQASSSSGPVRYAVRQVLDQEFRKEKVRKQAEALGSSKLAKTSKGKPADGQDDETGKKSAKYGAGVKRDFFGRIVQEPAPQPDSSQETPVQSEASKAGRKAWVTYHDGFSNAVRKPILMSELLAGF